MGSNSSTAAAAAVEEGDSKNKPSLYRKFADAKRGPGASDADIQKYTGKSREELGGWARSRPGVAGNQAAGKIDAGGSSGLGGVAAGAGLGGWGFEAGRTGGKYPPATGKKSKVVADGDEDSG